MDDLIERARAKASCPAVERLERELIAELADALAAAREREARLREGVKRLRARVHRLAGKGEAPVGWIDNPKAAHAIIEWEAEKEVDIVEITRAALKEDRP